MSHDNEPMQEHQDNVNSKPALRKSHFKYISVIVLAISGCSLFLYRPTMNQQSMSEQTIRTAIIKNITAPRNKHVLLTGHICPQCNNVTFGAISAFAACAARSFDMELHLVTEAPANSSNWPFPHYVKIYALEQLLKANDVASEGRWILWLDADVRVINLEYPLDQLLSYAENNDVHIITQTSGHGFGHVINNIFLIRNDDWGRRFVKVWRDLVWAGKSCGYYDQCPFGMAIIQLSLDYLGQGHENVSKILKQPIHPGLKRTALSGKKELLFDRLSIFACGGSCEQEDSSGLLKMGPVLRIPTWKPATLDGVLPSPLALEDGYAHQFLEEPNSTWPMAIHSKYSRLFCRRFGRPSAVEKSRFETSFRSQLQAKCREEERNNISKPGGPCWATYV
jgi:hypothetical protein